MRWTVAPVSVKRWLRSAAAALVLVALAAQLASPLAQALHEHVELELAHHSTDSSDDSSHHHDRSHCQTCSLTAQARTSDVPQPAATVASLVPAAVERMTSPAAPTTALLPSPASPRAPPMA